MTRRAQGARRKHGDTLTLGLRKPLERSVRSGHPWLYRDALEAFEAPAGTPVRVLDRSGRFLCTGLADAGPIGVRVFSLRDEPISPSLLASRIARAFALRARCMGNSGDTDAYRLLHGEGDFMPGFVCDRYGACAVLKLDGEAAPTRRDAVVASLVPELERLGVRSLLLRSGTRQDHSTDVIWGPPPPTELVVREHGMRLCTNVYQGQKTGLFLDHRETRRRVRQLADGSAVLNLYGYTGGFSIAAALGGGRSVTTVDQAKPALALAVRTFDKNGLGEFAHRTCAADALAFLGAAADGGERYQLVVSDPPNFAPKKSALDGALATYEALHSAALRVLEEGGLYVAASCSSHVDRAAFEETVRRGAAHQKRSVQVLERSSAPADHPRLLAFPEGDYLKILIARVF